MGWNREGEVCRVMYVLILAALLAIGFVALDAWWANRVIEKNRQEFNRD